MTPMHPRFVINPGDGESATSFCSRTARHLNRTAYEFCGDLGIPFQKLIDGDPTSVRSLAERCRADAECLQRQTIVKNSELSYTLYSQILRKDILQRNSLRVCAQCLAEDVLMGSHAIDVRPYGRSQWLIEPIRTCAIHNKALVEISRHQHNRAIFDFCAHVDKHLDQLQAIADHLPDRSPTAFEHYLSDRLTNGSGGAPWLDALPFYAAAKACSMIGGVAMLGASFRSKDLTEIERHDSERVGFEISKLGEPSIRSLLNQLQERFRRGKASWGAKSVFGRLYEWLAHDSEDRAYDPLRDIIRRHVIETMPVGPEDHIFGEPVKTRKMHSVYSASLEFGLHHKRLRKLLHAKGYIRHEDLHLSDDRVVFDAASTNDLLTRLSNAVSLDVANKYINVPPPHIRKLMSAGLIAPLASFDGAIAMFVFETKELDKFLMRLSIDATDADIDDHSLVTILRAARLASCSVADIVRLLFERKLSRVGRQSGVVGFLSILVDPTEIKPHVRGLALQGLRLQDVEARLAVKSPVARVLIENNYLPASTMDNPVNRRPQFYVKEADLEAFMDKYVSINTLVRVNKTRKDALRRKLEALGLQPSFLFAELDVSFYERPTVREHLSTY